MDITELSRQVAARENDVPTEEITHKQRKRVYVALHQNHLPQLEDAGFIDCGRSRDGIHVTDHASDLARYLDLHLDSPGLPPTVEAGITAAGALCVALAWLEIYPFVLLPDLAYAAAIVATLAIVTGVRLYRARTGRRESGALDPIG